MASRQAVDTGKQGSTGGNERLAGAGLFVDNLRQRDEPNNSIWCFYTRTPDIRFSQHRVMLEEDAGDNFYMAGSGGSGCAPFRVENGGRVDGSNLDGSERLEIEAEFLCFQEKLRELKTPGMALRRWGWRLLYASGARGRKGVDREAEDVDLPSRASGDFGERPGRLTYSVFLVYWRLFCR